MRLTLATLVLATAAAPALGQPVTQQNPGARIIVAGPNDVIATYLGSTASFSNDLFLQNTGQFLFNNQGTAAGSTINLGRFAAGTELVFRMFVNNTGTDFFSGTASRNPDGLGHAAVQSNYLVPGTTLVSFEDLPNSQDFNDLSFSLTGVAAVPEPASWALMLLGFGAVGAGLRVKRRRVSFAAA